VHDRSAVSTCSIVFGAPSTCGSLMQRSISLPSGGEAAAEGGTAQGRCTAQRDCETHLLGHGHMRILDTTTHTKSCGLRYACVMRHCCARPKCSFAVQHRSRGARHMRILDTTKHLVTLLGGGCSGMRHGSRPMHDWGATGRCNKLVGHGRMRIGDTTRPNKSCVVCATLVF
jgi:hypothetical protein